MRKSRKNWENWEKTERFKEEARKSRKNWEVWGRSEKVEEKVRKLRKNWESWGKSEKAEEKVRKLRKNRENWESVIYLRTDQQTNRHTWIGARDACASKTRNKMAMPIFHFWLACISKKSIQYLFKYWCARSLGTYGIFKAKHGVNDATFLCLSNTCGVIPTSFPDIHR